MNYEWDVNKARSNAYKHGIQFADAVSVFEDDAALTILDDNPSEERFTTIGMDAPGRILVVVYTWRGERIRIVSARKAESHERQEYGGGA